MRLIAIDTALEACSVGVVVGDRPPVTRSQIVGRGHAESLMGMIELALAEAGLSASDIDRIAVTVGPGSFTGLRIGIAAARGLALVTGAEAVGIGTLAVHAGEARSIAGPVAVLALLPAGRGKLYGQAFAPDGAENGPAEVAAPEAFAAGIRADTRLAGSGVDGLAAIIGDEAARRTVHRRSAPDVVSLCRLAVRAPSPTGAPRPLYLRPPDAKPQDTARIARR
jgi:tRNA threonylcarbamoyl adenosine modification protein YeaZ